MPSEPAGRSGLAPDAEERKRLLAREDAEFSRRNRLRSWLIIAGMLLVTLAWVLPLFFLAPGIR